MILLSLLYISRVKGVCWSLTDEINSGYLVRVLSARFFYFNETMTLLLTNYSGKSVYENSLSLPSLKHHSVFIYQTTAEFYQNYLWQQWLLYGTLSVKHFSTFVSWQSTEKKTFPFTFFYLSILYFSKSIINSWIFFKKTIVLGNSLVVQLLRLWTSTTGGIDSISTCGTRILHAKKIFVVIKCKVLKFSILCWLFLSYLQHF